MGAATIPVAPVPEPRREISASRLVLCRLAEGNHEDSRKGAEVVEVFAYLQNAAFVVEVAAKAALDAALLQRVLKNLPCDGAHLPRCNLIASGFVESRHRAKIIRQELPQAPQLRVTRW